MINKFCFYITLFLTNISFAQIEYKDVASIFISKCSYCHHQGTVHPSFTNYSEISSYKTLISYNISNGIMPPWPPDTNYTRFVHERIISQAEKIKILDWITSGTPSGDTTIAPVAPTYSQTKLNGVPDLILSIPTYTSNATTTDNYVCFSVPTGLFQDRMLRAYEVVPGNPEIVHHAAIYIDTIGNSSNNLSGNCLVSSVINLGSYVPGAPPIVFPATNTNKFGIKIKANSKIVFEMHYPQGSIGAIDSTEIRLFFYPIGEQNIRPMHVSGLLSNWSFSIAANTTNTVVANVQYAQDISIYSFSPHSHKICRTIKNFATNGSDTIPFCRINDWNIEWQGYYTYKNFIKVPNSFTIYGEHFFDNTTNNVYNPNPVNVSAGMTSSDEMLVDAFIYTDYQVGDENINIDSILNIDPLLNLPVFLKETNPLSPTFKVYPNPISNYSKILYELKNTDFVNIKVYDVLGNEIICLLDKQEEAGVHLLEWDSKNMNGEVLSAGVYFYKIQIGFNFYTQKIILNPGN